MLTLALLLFPPLPLFPPVPPLPVAVSTCVVPVGDWPTLQLGGLFEAGFNTTVGGQSWADASPVRSQV